MTLLSYNEAAPAVRKRFDFLNVPFDPVPFEEVIEEVKRFEETSAFRYIVTPNADHIARIKRGGSIRQYYDRAWLSLCDSSPVSAFAALLWMDLPIVTGSDLTEKMFRSVIRDHDRVTLVVASQDIAQRAIWAFPHVDFRFIVPPANLMSNPEAIQDCVDFVAEQPSRFVFIAVGSPQSERIAFGLTEHPDARGLAICCGASIEFIVGIQKRAPVILRGSGFEWLYRLAHNPKRLLGRYVFSVSPLLQLMGAELFKMVKVKR